MKTSPSQFDLMVTYMEQHGDLSKLSSNARGRLSNLKNWEELTNFLNSDGSGDTKSTEKWKKVWSDYKNNTKKKAARLYRAATGTGGGPATNIKLTDLEQRVLNLIGTQVATGLAVQEAGLAQLIHIQPSENTIEDVSTPNSHPHQFAQISHNEEETSGENMFSLPQTSIISSPRLNCTVEEIYSCQTLSVPGLSTTHVHSPPQARPATPHFSFTTTPVEDPSMLTPTRPSSQVHVGQCEPARSGNTTPRNLRTRRAQRSPRRRVRPAHTDQAAENFLKSDERWRKFKEQQHQDYMDLRRDQNRIREAEIQTQRELQAIGMRALNLIEKFVSHFCKD